MKHFQISGIVTIALLFCAYLWGGPQGLFLASVLAVMEVSLSFDNAVVNASVLKHWDDKWRKIFLTFGILIAVFGMRLLFPLVIVSTTTDMSIIQSANLALNSPVEYSKLLLAHHAQTAAFGGMFLLLVFLNFIIDESKEIHWLEPLEVKLAELGRIDSASIFGALGILVGISYYVVPPSEGFAVLVSGLLGILTYILVDILCQVLEGFDGDDSASNTTGTIVKGGIGGFIYLEILDASFSLDGVIGAFAITNDVVIIMIGLAIGALFVRNLTIVMVEKGTLDAYKYLEHGAHYAIGALAIIMLLSITYHIPEIVTGLIGIGFIVVAVLHSMFESKKQTT